MKKLMILSGFFLVSVISMNAQSVYQLAFNYPNINGAISFKAFLANNDGGKGVVRLKYLSPSGNDSMLVEMDVTEELADLNSTCDNSDKVYYKLQNPRYIECKDKNDKLPMYFCFKKNPVSGLYEPLGVSSSPDDCKTKVIEFRSVDFIEQKDLTADFVLKYFKVYDRFYRNLFVTNNTRALTVNEQNIKLILIVVANVTDPEIGQACRNDMRNVISFFGKITDFLGIQFRYDTIAGDNYYIQNVKRGITNLNPNPDDIVVFYYTGHGYRLDNDTRQAPYIDLRHKIEKKYNIFENTLNMDSVFTAIKQKGARLNLVLADCCNSLITFTNVKATAPAKGKGFGINWSTQNCRDLFLNATPTSILATAASPGQLATCNDEYGGFFSFFFRSALENNFSFFKNKVTWEQVLSETKAGTKFKANHTYCALPANPKNICNQYPFVDIRYGRF